MNDTTAYFMRDQIANRVREIMCHDRDPRPGGPLRWPLAAAVAALTLANIMLAVPAP